ncbi:uncharacterized protein LOC120730748 isoform X3 [Simochromis diagramma]|uniref:uncharacterized protein LOC120730748 isoform X3 n=1 Tax=Simochromis diagramma TaxID=43689 RepID=UPI001A7EE5EA|nr:uncharacterized protein LOC120730748 isoform X3 [Simochromis diagramma]
MQRLNQKQICGSDTTLSSLVTPHCQRMHVNACGMEKTYFFFVCFTAGSLGTPSITVRSSFINKSCSTVTVECSVHNSQDLVLSWYRQEGRLTNVSSPDLSSNLHLTLEIESHDSGSYSCVAENPVEKKVTKLSGEDTTIKMGSGESRSWCQTESTVRLVISTVFGMALIILVVDHIRLRR